MALFEITADSLIEVSQASFADLKIYTMNDHDRELARSGSILLDKMMRATWVRPAELITITRLQHMSPIEKPST
jgi:hypothetical protein